MFIWMAVFYLCMIVVLQLTGAIVHVSFIYGKPAYKSRRKRRSKSKRKYAGKSNGFRNYSVYSYGYMAGKVYKGW